MTKPWNTMAGLRRHWDPDQEKALCQEGNFDQTNQESYTKKEQLIETWQERLLHRWDAPWKKWRRTEDTSAEAASTRANRNRRLGGRQKEVKGEDQSLALNSGESMKGQGMTKAVEEEVFFAAAF